MNRALVAAIVVISGLTGCTSQPASSGGGHTPSPSAASGGIEGYSAQEWARLWAQYNVTPPPADDPMTVHKPAAVKVQNLTRGAVSDADAQKWGDGFLRSVSVTVWAEDHLNSDVLAHGLGEPAFAATNLFDISIPQISSAQQKGAKSMETTYRQPTAIGIVVVPDSLKATYDNKAPLTHYALVVWNGGPSDTVFVYADGRREDLGARSDPPEEFVISGQYLDRGKNVGSIPRDLPFGPFWFQESSWSCQRHTDLGPVCSQIGQGS